MTPERWLQVERIYHGALERPPVDRSVFLDDSCSGDDDLKNEVQSLLDESSPDGDFLEQPPLAAAAAHQTQNLVGRRLSEYELTERIGAGGMGEVYRARDVKLGRDVAIKVLPGPLAHDVERVSRFRREAQILATLNHPHIAAIYALEESDGVLGLVLELVEGATLADRSIKAAAVERSADDRVSNCRCARDSARQGHRPPRSQTGEYESDAKRHREGAGFRTGESSSDRFRLTTCRSLSRIDGTQEGVVLGTVTYMSPEQARGLPVDTRTDIWAFGCVLYEMLTGRKAFHGDTATDCLAAIVGKEPDWTALPPSTPPSVVALLQRCLEKDAQRRLPDIGEARRELEDRACDRHGADAMRPAVECQSDGVRVCWSTPGFDRRLSSSPASFGVRARSSADA